MMLATAAEKRDAYATTAKALRDGVLVRQPCEVCGDAVGIHGHHEDYSKPLEICWLCLWHHRERHKRLGWPRFGRKRTGGVYVCPIQIQIESGLKDKVIDCARAEGMSVSAWIRRLIIRELAKQGV